MLSNRPRPRLTGAGSGAGLLDRQQALEEDPVAPQPLPKVLGGGVAAGAALGLELFALAGERLGQPVYQLRHERVGFADGPSRLLHEAGLNLVPAAHDA